MKQIDGIRAPLVVAYPHDAIVLATAGAERAGTNPDPVKIAKAIDGLEPGGTHTEVQFGAPESS
jgi:hypothetical protein